MALRSILTRPPFSEVITIVCPHTRGSYVFNVMHCRGCSACTRGRKSAEGGQPEGTRCWRRCQGAQGKANASQAPILPQREMLGHWGAWRTAVLAPPCFAASKRTHTLACSCVQAYAHTYIRACTDTRVDMCSCVNNGQFALGRTEEGHPEGFCTGIIIRDAENPVHIRSSFAKLCANLPK